MKTGNDMKDLQQQQQQQQQQQEELQKQEQSQQQYQYQYQCQMLISKTGMLSLPCLEDLQDNQ